MSNSDVVERVARAIMREICYGSYGGCPCESSGECDGEPSPNEMIAARAAIAAMREPTEAMLVAEGVNEMGGKERLGEYLDNWSADGVWRAMIEAALLPSPPVAGLPSSQPNRKQGV